MINILSKKLTTFIILVLVISIGVFLRFYELGINPPSLDWDEASIGYNAYSILRTGADEYGNKFPLSIRSFDDYKPPLYVYLAVPSVGIFGLNEFSVRLPAAVIGVLSVIAIYFLVKEMLQGWDRRRQDAIALASAFFLAISPWSLQFSRAAFEGNIGVFFFILGVLLFLKAIKSSWFFPLSSIAFIFSIYSYHSFRLLIPLIVVFLIIGFFKNILKNKIFFAVFIFILLFFTFPVYFGFLKSQDAGSRLSMVTIFSEPSLIEKSIKRIDYDRETGNQLGMFLDNRRIIYGLAVIKGYLDHFNPDFLFLHGDGGVQHHAVDMGMLYLWDLPFILGGIYYLSRRFNRFILILFMSFLLSPLPAAITTGTPHPVRAIGMLLGFPIFAAVGIVFFWEKIMLLKNLLIKFTLVTVIAICFIFNFVYYIHQYYVHTPIEYGYFWQYGYKEALNYAEENEGEFENIIMTYEYDQPYIYYLFYNKTDPAWYQKNWDYRQNGSIDRFQRIIGKYTFRNIDYAKDIKIPDALIIGSPKEIPENAKVIKTIKFPDGKIAFKIVKT